MLRASEQARLEFVRRVLAMTDAECLAALHLVDAVKVTRARRRPTRRHKNH